VLVAMVTKSSKTSVSIGTARCCKGKAIHNSELVSLWKRKKSVFGFRVNQSTPVRERVVVSESPESEEYSARSEL
jgi:hypothetical protein